MSRPPASHPLIRSVRLTGGTALLTRRFELAPGQSRLEISLGAGEDPGSARAWAFATSDGGQIPLPTVAQAHRPEDTHDETFEERREAEADERRRSLLETQAAQAVAFIGDSWLWARPPTEVWRAFFERHADERASLAVRRLRRAAHRTAREAEGRPSVATVEVVRPPHLINVPAQVELSTQSSAGTVQWKLRYELRMDGNEPGQAEWVAILQIEQNTGVPWTSVELSVAADDDRPEGTAPPPLPRLLVSGFQAAPLPAGAHRSQPERPPPVPHRATRRPPGPVDVGTDGPTRIELWSRRVPCEQAIETWLGIDMSSADRVAWVKAPAELEVAPVSILVDGTFVGALELTPRRHGERVRIPLGPSPHIEVERSDRSHPARRSRASNRLEHRFAGTVTLRETGGQDVTLDVRARLPVPATPDVELEIRTLPPGMAVDSDTGFAHLVAHIPAGGERRFEHDFSVHAPRSVVVTPEDNGE